MSTLNNPLVTYNFPEAAAASAGSNSPGLQVVYSRDPTTQDLSGPSGSYRIGQMWWSTSSNTLFILESTTGGSATWVSTGAVTTPVTVPNGGTGRNSLTNHGVIVGAGASAVTQLAVGTNGQVLVGSTGADPVFSTITSSDGSIAFTTGAGTLDMVASLTTNLASPPPIGNVAPNTGAFTTLTSNNTTTIGNGSGITTTIGNTGGAAAVNINVGTGNFAVSGAVTSTYSIGSSTGTGDITVGKSTAAETINICSAASNTGAQVVNILNGATPGADTTLNIMDGAGTAGTQTVNMLATGATRAGAVNIGTGAAAHAITIGSSSAGAMALASGTSIGITGANAAITVASGTGEIDISADAAATTVKLGTGAGAKVVSVGSTNGASSLTLNAGTGNMSVATAGNGTITVTSGTGEIDISADAAATTVKLGTGAAAKTVTIGSTNTTSTTTVQAGSGGIALSAGGAVSMAPATGSVAGTSLTLNSRVGVATFTGLTTASGATQALTISNSTVLATSGVFCSIANLNASTNNAGVAIVETVQAAGSLVVTYKNNGAGALGAGDNVLVTFWVIS